jgi:lipid-A-disaccharide synthase
MTRPLTVMLVAAEASGDNLGAGLARALRARLGEGVRFIGVGGGKMAAEGVESPFNIAELSILGLFEALAAYPRVRRRVADTAALAAADRPDVAVLIDSWGFTLRVAHTLRRLYPDLPLVKYVGPQVWATRPGRAKTLARSVDHLLSIHAFDAPWFEKEGLPVTFVGNPALAGDFSGADPARLRAAIGAGPDDPILLVLPGSRPAEIKLVIDRKSTRLNSSHNPTPRMPSSA